MNLLKEVIKNCNVGVDAIDNIWENVKDTKLRETIWKQKDYGFVRQSVQRTRGRAVRKRRYVSQQNGKGNDEGRRKDEIGA